MASPSDQMMRRYKLVVEYDGTRFKGFQRQSSGENENEATPRFPKKRRVNAGGQAEQVPVTIQACLEDSLMQYSGINRQDLALKFAGRTDAGVHARGQVVVANLRVPIMAEYWMIQKSINSRLPSDISIKSIDICQSLTFDPRHDVKMKQYSYTVKYRRKVVTNDGKLLPICEGGPNTVRSALDPPTVWVCPWALDDSKVDEFCQRLTGTQDYSAFVHKKARRERENIITVDKLVCERLAETNENAPVVTVRFLVESQKFRRSMVRNLVGFLVDLCRGSVQESILDELWTGTDDVANQVHSAPACGLCLEYVAY
jgi:tRNA pseudouridine38-40 synthase